MNDTAPAVRSHRAPTPFRAKRWLGIPAPVVAVVLAVVLVGGVALAAIFFSARATVQGDVRSLPQLAWQDQSAYEPVVYNCDGVSAGVGLASQAYANDTLALHLNSAYPGSSVDIVAWLLVPNGSATLQVTAFSLGNADKITATLVDTVPDQAVDIVCPGDGSLGTGSWNSPTARRQFTTAYPEAHPGGARVVGSALTGGVPALNGSPNAQYLIHIHVSVLATAAPGAFTDVIVPGLTVQIVS